MSRFFCNIAFIALFICTIACYSAENLRILSAEFGFVQEVGVLRVSGPIEAVALFQDENDSGAYVLFRTTSGQLELARWSEQSGIAWQRELMYPVFISLSTSSDGGMVAACTWEDESVLGFVYDKDGRQLERKPLDALSKIDVFTDGSGWSVSWAMFDWLTPRPLDSPPIIFIPECRGIWNMKPLPSGETFWWHRPMQGAICPPMFAITNRSGQVVFKEHEDKSFVTLFADVISDEGKLVLIKEGEDSEGEQAREMIALSAEGERLWRVQAHRQSSQVSGFINRNDFVLLFAGKDFEYRDANSGALIASDTLRVHKRERLFPIQGFLVDDEEFLVLGRRVLVHVILHSGEGISDCHVLNIGGALSFNRELCALFDTTSDSSATTCIVFRRER